VSNSDSRRPKADGASDAALVRRNSDARLFIVSGKRAVVYGPDYPGHGVRSGYIRHIPKS